LSNKAAERVAWLIEHQAALREVRLLPWSALQPLLVAEGIEDLLAMEEAAHPGSAEARHCRTVLEQPREVLDPPPLLTGDDLLAHGVPAGPLYRTLLDAVRRAQLDGEIGTKAEALALVDRLIARTG
jgi:hypothetical protein